MKTQTTIVYAWHGVSDTWTCVVYELGEPILVGTGRRLRDCVVDMAMCKSDTSELAIGTALNGNMMNKVN